VARGAPPATRRLPQSPASARRRAWWGPGHPERRLADSPTRRLADSPTRRLADSRCCCASRVRRASPSSFFRAMPGGWPTGSRPDRRPSQAGRLALGPGLWETGRPEQARIELEALVGPGAPEIPADGDWLPVTALLAELACELGDAERAAILFRSVGAPRAHDRRVRDGRDVLGRAGPSSWPPGGRGDRLRA
jgi:hypothetical protein